MNYNEVVHEVLISLSIISRVHVAYKFQISSRQNQLMICGLFKHALRTLLLIETVGSAVRHMRINTQDVQTSHHGPI